MTEGEVWRPIPGYEGYYEASSLGAIRSVPREVTYRDGRRYTYPGKVLTPSDNGCGYQVVTLSKSKLSKKVRFVHHLVMEAFVGKRPPGLDTCHRDNDKTNNKLSNLRYDTRESNLSDSSTLAEFCQRGHPISGANEMTSQRRCLACSRASNYCRYWGKPVTSEIADAYYREVTGSEEPGDEEIIGRKFKRVKKVENV